MRTLHIGFTVPALCQALSNASSEYLFLDWTAWTSIPNNTEALHKKTLEVAHEFNPDLVFLHVQSPGVYTSQVLANLPGFVVNWTWDYRDPTPEWMVKCGKSVDLTGFTNETDVKIMRDLGMNASFIQSGFNDEVFRPDGPVGEYPEIVFMGNNYPKEDYTFPLADFRTDMVGKLRSKYGNRFGVYGFGWGNDMMNFMYREKKEAECYRSCKIAINLSHFDADRYTSDRMLRLMGSGAFCLSKWYPGIEQDFLDKINIGVWNDLDELTSKIDYYLEHKDERMNIAMAGCVLAHKKYTWHKMVDNIKGLMKTTERKNKIILL